MKICALTMVYQDYWALSQWYRHYKRHLGEQNLFVISHGSDPKIAEICKGASIITIPRDDLRNFDRVRFKLMNSIQAGLGNIYDWVIQSDADELVCFDPTKYSSFEDLFRSTKAPVLFALGLNVAEVEGDKELDADDNALAHRSIACVTGNYSKAWAVKEALPLKLHGVFCGNKKANEFPFEMPDGVFFVHLKHASIAALRGANNVRKSVADSVGKDWKVTGWAKPRFQSKRFFTRLAEMDETPWNDAVALGYSRIRANPVRDPDRGVVKPPFIPYLARTTLPDWFKDC